MPAFLKNDVVKRALHTLWETLLGALLVAWVAAPAISATGEVSFDSIEKFALAAMTAVLASLASLIKGYLVSRKAPDDGHTAEHAAP